MPVMLVSELLKLRRRGGAVLVTKNKSGETVGLLQECFKVM